MIEGHVNAALEAVVTLPLQGPDGQTEHVEAVVDTGYSGFLMLPSALVTELSFDVYTVTVLWDGEPRYVEVDLTGTTPLMGMQMLEGHSLNIEVEDRGRVLMKARE